MINRTADTSLNKTARIAGLLFLITFIIPTINFSLVFFKFIVVENVIATANNIMTNELLFRIGIFNELIISAVGVVFALTFYLLLKQVNKNLASLALSFKMIEAILWAVTALGHFIALQILKEQASLTVFEPEQIQALIGLFINPYVNVSSIALVFHGLNATIFLNLLYKSKYVPRILAGYGVLAYALIFIYALIIILLPNLATMMIIQISCVVPSILLELILGSWLLIKGVKVQPGRINE